MKRLLAVLTLVFLPMGARADVAPAPPMWTRVPTADVIVVGRVIGLEDKDIEPASIPKLTYRIAVVTVQEGLKDAKDLKKVRVGFNPDSKRGLKLAAGSEGLLFLTKHPTEPFYYLAGFFDFVSSQFPTTDKQIAEVKELSKILANAGSGLKSKDGGERFLSAALLVIGYRHDRWRPNSKARTEPIDAAESKLILEALADADWMQKTDAGRPAPAVVFELLGLEKADGWDRQRPFAQVADYHDAARAWLKANAATYRVKRIVPEIAK